jgi:hypothetical protein
MEMELRHRIPARNEDPSPATFKRTASSSPLQRKNDVRHGDSPNDPIIVSDDEPGRDNSIEGDFDDISLDEIVKMQFPISSLPAG